MKKFAILFSLSFLIISGCTDNNPDSAQISSVFVINEGNFSDSNGSITSYDPELKSAVQNAFQNANGRPFAGYIQSAAVINDRLYIVSNMSNKIEVVDLKTLSSVGTIEYSKTPTAIAPAGNGQAYVTNLYDGSVTAIDLETLQETDQTIPVGANPYFAYKKGGKVFVSNNGFGSNNTISVIEVATGAVENIEVGIGPNQIIEDPSGLLWVICEGAAAYDENGNRNPENDTPGGIFIVDPEQLNVVDSIENGGRPTFATIDARNSRAYAIYASDDVKQINLNTHEISNDDFISRSFSTVGYSAEEQLLYFGKSNGLTQPGRAIRYDLQGTAIDSFQVGISPVEFEFVTN